MSSFIARLVALVCFLVLFIPAGSRAQTGFLRGSADMFRCDFDAAGTDCVPGSMCGADPVGTCLTTHTGLPVCITSTTSLCCTTVDAPDDCLPGYTCRQVRTASGGGPAINACIPDEACPDPDPAMLSNCFVNATMGSRTSIWELGDCDSDAVPNDADGCPCLHGAGDPSGCPPASPDGGVLPPGDAGSVDGGPGPGADGGGSGSDAGEPTPPDANYRGAGGCVCRAAPARTAGLEWAGGAVLLFALRIRARRSAARRTALRGGRPTRTRSETVRSA